MEKIIVNRGELAARLKVSLPTIDSWIREGLPVVQAGGRGRGCKIDLDEAWRWRGERDKAKAEAEAPPSGPVSGEEMDAAKFRKLSAEAEMAELELAKAKGDVALISEFAQAHAKRMVIIRTNIMSVPQRAVLQLLGETNETTFKAKLRAELVLALTQAANTDIEWD